MVCVDGSGAERGGAEWIRREEAVGGGKKVAVFRVTCVALSFFTAFRFGSESDYNPSVRSILPTAGRVFRR